MDEAKFSRYLEALEEDGYCIVDNAIEPSLLDEVRKSVARLETDLNIEPRGNRAEGFATKRMYNLLGKDRVFWKLPVHPNVLPFAERLFCLLYTSPSPRDRG